MVKLDLDYLLYEVTQRLTLGRAELKYPTSCPYVSVPVRQTFRPPLLETTLATCNNNQTPTISYYTPTILYIHCLPVHLYRATRARDST